MVPAQHLMTINLVNFGDSWAHGADAGMDKRYCCLLAHWLGINLIDHSVPSTSIPGLVLQLKKFLSSEFASRSTNVALFFLTAQDRQLLSRQGRIVESCAGAIEDIDYYAKHYDPFIGRFVMNTTVLSLQRMCDHHGIIPVFLAGWEPLDLWVEVNRQCFFEYGATSALDLILHRKKKTLHEAQMSHGGMFVNGHPNAAAHYLIAESLLPMIQKIISPFVNCDPPPGHV